MKKLFISCPMKGRTDEAIVATREAMRKIAEEFFGEELEVIPNFIPAPKDLPEGTNQSIWCLGRSIQMMAEADYFICVAGVNVVYHGCDVELSAAAVYDIPRTYINHNGFAACKDVTEAINKYWDDLERGHRARVAD